MNVILFILLRFECVGDVRGSGLVLSVELVNNKQDRYPASELASQVMIEMKNKQILTAVTGRDQNVLLITPPMCFNIENCRTFTNALEQILSTINQSSMNISSDFLQLEVEDERPTKRLKMEDNDLVSLNNDELSSLFDMD